MAIPENTPYGGFLLAFEPLRTEMITNELRSFEKAAESFSARDWKFEPREIVLLVLNAGTSSIAGAALMQRMGGSGGTAKLKMALSDPVLFDWPVWPEELEEVGDIATLVSTAERLKRIDPNIWNALIERLNGLRPEWANAMDSLVAKRKEDPRLLGDSPRITRLVEQRDAVGIVLDIAGAETGRRELLATIKPERLPDARSVLDLLDHQPLDERAAMEHDARVFGGLLDPSMRQAHFDAKAGRGVRIYVHDNTPLEAVLGTDLLIFQERYRSYLLVQYKNMTPVDEASGRSWSYLANRRFHVQLARMQRAEQAIRAMPTPTDAIHDWRLHDSPFYWKFCETTRPNSRDFSLLSGIILGAEHLQRFVAAEESAGRNGGTRVGYENCARYLNNSQFTDLARHGWIGCGPQGFGLISELLAANQRRGKKRAMLAVIEGALDHGAGGRSWRR
jgi:hypothetical protein